MMKWGRKKKPSLSPSSVSASSSSSQPHLISHVFPLSWFSKSKQPRGEKPGSRTETITQKGKQNPQRLIPRSPMYSNSSYNNRYYYTQDDDGFWRLSFGDHNHQNRDLEPQSNIKQSAMKRRSHRSNRNSPRGGISSAVKDDESQEWQKLKEAKIKEFLSKNSSNTEKQRKSFHMSRQSKVRVQSPKTPSKIKALENSRKMKMKMKTKEIVSVEDHKSSSLESFAVVKSSKNPQQDFRDSMVEMIMEKGITRHDELEELLACYLTLNADEYHDLIIKVFREVWIQLENTYFDHQKSTQEHYFHV